MELEARLRAFAALARRGSFSGAADELYVSQPAVSKHLAALEAEVGKPLVLRGRAGSPLTPAGELLAEYVLRAEALLANAKRALRAGAEAETGTLALAASGIPGTYLLPEVLLEFRDRYPGVELEVVGGLEPPAEVESEPLLDDEVVLVGAPPLGGRRLRPKDLEHLTWISRAEGSATRAAVETARWEMGLHAVKTIELPSWEAVKRAVAKGFGIAAVSRLALDVELEAGALVVLDVPRWRLTRTIALVRARGVPLTPPAERFVSLLRERLAPSHVPAPNSNLPAAAAPLVGRARELAETTRLLRGGARLVTFTGAGGSGKTRLALETGTALVDDFPDGVYLVELAPLREPEDVEAAIAGVLLAGPDQLRDRLREAAPVVPSLLGEAPGLHVLATSRRPLHVAGEREYRVEPLQADAAAELFVSRARDVNPRFGDGDAVRRICDRLDRLPLALELAAARARGTTASRLASVLERQLPVLAGRRDAPARQRTLTAAIAWSYDLLARAQQDLLARLSVFRGGCTPEAAEDVCTADGGDLTALVEVGLARAADDGRLALLETVREFAAERLDDARELRFRHAEHYVALAEEARSHARGPREKEWIERLTVELDNLRAVLAFSLEIRDAALGLRLAEALEPLWIRGMHQREALRWLEPLLGLEPQGDQAVRAGAFVLAGRSAIEAGEPQRARPWLETGLALARESGDERRTAWALHGLGHALAEAGDSVRAQSLLQESMELFLRLGEHAPAGGRMTFLAYYAFRDGDLERAQALLERATEQYRLAGDEAGVGGCTHGLGDLELARGDLEAAVTRFREAQPLLVRSGSSFDLAYTVGAVAAVAGQAGEQDVAGRLWGAFERLEEESERVLEPEVRALYERSAGVVDAVDVEAGRALSEDDAVLLAQRATDDLAASRRSSLPRTSGHSSSSTE